VLMVTTPTLPDQKYTMLGLVQGSVQSQLGPFQVVRAEDALERAAKEKGADAVIDVRLIVTPWPEEGRSVTFTLIGTAVKFA
jgi:uncharacterized protein YbjQ (UPF0145 family)